MASFEENTLSDSSVTHTRVLDYSYRIPTPPRIVVPPPTMHSENEDFGLDRIVPSDDQQLDLSFLERVNYASIGNKLTILDWAYEKRRQAQSILPFLYLGPMPAAKNREFLQSEGITMVLAVRPRQMTPGSAALQVAAELGLHIDTLEAAIPQNLIAAFPRAVRSIQQHLCYINSISGGQRLGKIFIFCESGNDRSAAVTAAYLMETFENVDYVKAMQIVQAQRFCVNFDDVHKQLLRSYWDIIQARRSVAQARQIQTLHIHNEEELLHIDEMKANSNHKPKRTIEDSCDEEMGTAESSHADDEARFGGRRFVPFKDGL